MPSINGPCYLCWYTPGWGKYNTRILKHWKRIGNLTSKRGQYSGRTDCLGGHPATKGSNTPSPPCLNETLNCHACLRYPMRIIPSYYWSWTWKKSSRRVGCVWCVGVSGCIDCRLQTSFLFALEVMSLYFHMLPTSHYYACSTYPGPYRGQGGSRS